MQEFARSEALLPSEVYARELAAHGVTRANQFKSTNIAWACHQKLQAHLVEQRAQQMHAEGVYPATFEHFLATEGEAV